MNEPKIRIKGFKGEWETKEIQEIFDIRNGYTPSKAVSSFWTNGTIPWFRMEDIRENGGILSDSIQHITPSAVKGAGLFTPFSIILATTATIGVHAMLITESLANQRFTNLKISESQKSFYDPYFIYYAFFKVDEWCKENTNSGGLLAVDINSLLKYRFPAPSLSEQSAIATYFRHLDELIETVEKKVASLKQVKEASLQSMFPQEGQTVPKVRFKGFEGEWKEEELGNLFDERIENDVNAEMLSVTQNQGIIKASENGRYDNSNNDKSKYRLVKIGDIAYNSMRMWQGASGYSPYEGIVSPAYTVVSPKDGVDSLFFSYMFKTNLMIKEFRLHSQGLTTDTWNLKYPAFSVIKTSYPSNINEQRKIASFFTNLDKEIGIQQHRLTLLKRIKSACLDEMFV